ncbi:MAG: excinuclease ABC subunit UvrA [bacterium]|nr:excinuclease ABC subunit UvrA [bacterium]
MEPGKIIIRGAREHNLKNISVEIPRNSLAVITGVSGSGKSSLAFDTIYAEGQRRYVESLSAYARQFLEQMEKPDVDEILGLSPAISIEQKTVSKNPRSTVGTVTEIYDYLRVLFARIGRPHCPRCGQEISSQTPPQIVDRILEMPPGSRIVILAPIVRGRKGEYRKELSDLRRQGFLRVIIDGEPRELTEEIELDRKRKHTIEVVIDRVTIPEGAGPKGKEEPSLRPRLAEAVELATGLAEGIVRIKLPDNQTVTFSSRFACLDCGIDLPEINPRIFSFNNPYGACPECDGLGTKTDFAPALVVPDENLSLREGAIEPWQKKNPAVRQQILESLSRRFDFDIYTPWKTLPPAVREIILSGTGEEKIEFWYERAGKRHRFLRPFPGVIGELRVRLDQDPDWSEREELSRYLETRECSACRGTRLRPESLSVKIAQKSIAAITCLTIAEIDRFFSEIQLSSREAEIARRLLKEIRERLGFLIKVGVDYLTLDRPANSLAGGEGQRIRLATQIGSGLVGVLYILDEPSVGLHKRDQLRLLRALERLRDLGNTVIVVEHDEETILSADWVLDLGPGAGRDGGRIVVAGTPEEIKRHPSSLTGGYLSGRWKIPVPPRKKPDGRFLEIKGAREHNLKNLTVRIPLGLITCVTGVSGSGKSSLIIDTLYPILARYLQRDRIPSVKVEEVKGLEHLDRVINIDQSPIGRTPRSNPATYTGVFTEIRDVFAGLPEAKARAYHPGRFSFNVKGGRCEACEGDGVIQIEMHFLPDVFVQCEHCRGKRYNRDTLEITYKGKNIAEVLEMTVAEAEGLFSAYPRIRDKLRTLAEVDLGYLCLGQSATTLSGGEAQRIKLARELSKRSTGRTLYLLDEPTTGLHFADIQHLLGLLFRLRDEGNTVIIIEHNLDVVKSSDYVIDLGPEGGEQGGGVVGTGTPEELARIPESHTGRFLAELFNK